MPPQVRMELLKVWLLPIAIAAVIVALESLIVYHMKDRIQDNLTKVKVVEPNDEYVGKTKYFTDGKLHLEHPLYGDVDWQQEFERNFQKIEERLNGDDEDPYEMVITGPGNYYVERKPQDLESIELKPGMVLTMRFYERRIRVFVK